jgi:hypothetical protein
VQTPGDIPLQPFRYCPTRQEAHVEQADAPGHRLDGDRLLTGEARIEYNTTYTALIHPVSCISTVSCFKNRFGHKIFVQTIISLIAA